MIKAAKQATIIWMNHVTTVAIIRQINLTTSFTNKLNLHLIQTAAYIQQFQLKIHHKSDKQNTVSDAFSKLLHQEAEANKRVYSRHSFHQLYLYLLCINNRSLQQIQDLTYRRLQMWCIMKENHNRSASKCQEKNSCKSVLWAR